MFKMVYIDGECLKCRKTRKVIDTLLICSECIAGMCKSKTVSEETKEALKWLVNAQWGARLSTTHDDRKKFNAQMESMTGEIGNGGFKDTQINQKNDQVIHWRHYPDEIPMGIEASSVIVKFKNGKIMHNVFYTPEDSAHDHSPWQQTEFWIPMSDFGEEEMQTCH